MERYRRELIKECINLLAVELAELLLRELKKDLSIFKGASRGERKIILKPSKKKRPWVKNRTDCYYEHESYLEMPPEIFSSDPSLYFLKTVGIEQEQFRWLLDKISPFIQKQDTLMRDALPAHIKLKVVLGYLIMGGSYQYLSNQFQIPKNSISSFLSDVMSAICNALEEFIKIPSTNEEWKSIMEEFNEKYNFPDCYGSLDAKCLQILSKKPPAGSVLPNRKHNSYFYFVMLVSMVDAQHCFTYVDIKTTIRSKQDTQNFENIPFVEALVRNDFNLPNNAVIVANNLFPLTDMIITPFSQGKDLTDKQVKYNDHVEQVLHVNDHTLKILSTNFRVFDKVISVGVDKIPTLVKSCCSLHNWLIKTNSSYSQPRILDPDECNFHSCQQAYSAGGAFQCLNKISSFKSNTAIKKRNWYLRYFNEETGIPNNKCIVTSITDVKMETDT